MKRLVIFVVLIVSMSATVFAQTHYFIEQNVRYQNEKFIPTTVFSTSPWTKKMNIYNIIIAYSFIFLALYLYRCIKGRATFKEAVEIFLFASIGYLKAVFIGLLQTAITGYRGGIEIKNDWFLKPLAFISGITCPIMGFIVFNPISSPILILLHDSIRITNGVESDTLHDMLSSI